MLNVPSAKIDSKVRRLGGGFGGKESQGNLPAIVAALAAKLTGRPAKLIYDRDDDFILTGKRHDFQISYKVGFEDNGLINSVIVDQAIRCGMSWDCLLYTSPSPRDATLSRMPSSA